jgi:hypothetical protein
MKKRNHSNREKIYWLEWLLLVIAWNYSYPEATPFLDVLVALILSLIFILLKKKK